MVTAIEQVRVSLIAARKATKAAGAETATKNINDALAALEVVDITVGEIVSAEATRMVTVAVAAENKACAKIIQEARDNGENNFCWKVLDRLVVAIRARRV